MPNFSRDTGSANGTALVNANGTYSYTPSRNFSGNDSFTYTVSDGNGGFATGTVALSIAAVADVPVLTTVPVTGEVGDTVTLDVTSTLADVDGSESLSIEISGVPSGLSLSKGVDQGGGVWTLNRDDLNNLTLTIPADARAGFELTVTARSTEASNGNTATKRHLCRWWFYPRRFSFFRFWRSESWEVTAMIVLLAATAMTCSLVVVVRTR